MSVEFYAVLNNLRRYSYFANILADLAVVFAMKGSSEHFVTTFPKYHQLWYHNMYIILMPIIICFMDVHGRAISPKITAAVCKLKMKRVSEIQRWKHKGDYLSDDYGRTRLSLQFKLLLSPRRIVDVHILVLQINRVIIAINAINISSRLPIDLRPAYTRHVRPLIK